MSSPRKGRADTFDKIEAKYEDYRGSRPPPPSSRRAYVPENLLSEGLSKIVLTAIGVGTGVLLLILAGIAFWTAAWWGDFGRDGAVTGYTLVGFFLTVAGLSAIIATWHHMFRVLDPDRAPPAHH